MMNLMQKGQGTLETLISIPIVVIGLLVVFLILEPISQELFLALDFSNSAVISQITTIKILVGLIGLIIVAMTIVAIVQSFRRPRTPTGFV